jgi:hypothetical protein
MKTIKYTYWKDGNFYLGYLNDYPDYQTQGLSKGELIDNLKDILKDIESEFHTLYRRGGVHPPPVMNRHFAGGDKSLPYIETS